MNNPKRHHFVPEMLQKRFANDQGGLWSYDSRRAEKGVRADMPGNLMLVGHLYTFVDEKGQKDISLESAFSTLESLADPIVQKIADRVSGGKLPNLTSEERTIWDEFFLQQWRRVPDVHDSLMSEGQYLMALEEAMEKFSRTYRPVTPEERQHFLSPERIKRGRSNLRVRSLQRRSEILRDALSRRGLVFARVINPNKSIILPSRPVVKVTSADVSVLTDDRVQAWLPIAPGVVVSPGYGHIPEFIIDLSDGLVRQMNLALAVQSTQIVGRSKALITSIAPFVGTAIGKYC
jgi:Protein of unknown function (DUF4238)